MPIVCQQALELLAGVLRSLVRVMQQRVSLAPSPDGHHQGVHDQRGIPLGLHRPAHDPTGKQIQHDRHIQPALGSPDVGEVGQPLVVRVIRFEIPVEDVVGDHRPLANVLGPSAPLWARFQCVLAHQPLDPVKAADQALFKDVMPNTPGAIGPAAGLEALVDGRDELCIKDRPVAERTVQPGMEA